MITPTRIEDDRSDQLPTWCLIDHSTNTIDLRLQYRHWHHAESDAINHPSFYWSKLAAELAVA